MIRTAHLFAGAGGGLLADLILGHTPVLAVEKHKGRCNVIRRAKHDGWFPRLHVECCDIRDFDFGPWREKVDCIAAGFPCQDISSAGTGKGIKGAKSGLVWEVFRAIDVVRPGLVFLENSPRIRTRGRREIIRALVERGYSWRDGTLAASDIGAPHRRSRWWLLVANADGKRKLEQEGCIQDQRERVGNGAAVFTDTHKGGRIRRTRNIAEAEGWDGFTDRLVALVEGCGLPRRDAEAIAAAAAHTGAWWWLPFDSGLRGMVDGVADRVDIPGGTRIAMCGDGQVPLQAAAAWIILAGK